jgi:hypothetical protein
VRKPTAVWLNRNGAACVSRYLPRAANSLNTVRVNRDADLVTYVEESLWIQHY